MPRKTSPPKLGTLHDDLAGYILGLATESKVSPSTNKISNRLLDQWLNKLKLSATNKKFNALSSNVVSFHQDEEAQMIELENLKITPQIVDVLNKKIKKPDLILSIILRNITFKNEDTRNKFEELLKRFKNVSMVEYDKVDFGDHIFLNSKKLIDIKIKNSTLSKILIMKFKPVLFDTASLERVSFIGNDVDDYFYTHTFYEGRIDKDNIMLRNHQRNIQMPPVLLNIQGNTDSKGNIIDFAK